MEFMTWFFHCEPILDTLRVPITYDLYSPVLAYLIVTLEAKEQGEIIVDNDELPRESAARHRRLPESINEQVLLAARQELQKRKKKKIELPEEPAEGALDCVLVTLRTPLRDLKQRRFKSTDTIQHVLDYMTYIGFHQKKYTLVTSYPRQCLSDQREVTLADMGFKTRTTLNVEEKDWE